MMFLAGCAFIAALWALSRTDWRDVREPDFPLFDAARVDLDLTGWEEWDADEAPAGIVVQFPTRDRGQVPA